MKGKLSSSSFLCFKFTESSSFQEQSLMDLIALMDGHCDIPIHGFEKIPVRIFSAAELSKATKSFNPARLITEDALWKIYKGSFKKQNLVLIKIYETDEGCFPHNKFPAVCDIAIAAQMRNHDNVLKLVGVCLEFDAPALVYEHPESVRLISNVLFGNESLAWKNRLGLAYNIASAILHLHTAFPSKIVHRNLKLENIFLDDKAEIAKLFDFSLAICMPPSKSQVNNNIVVGTKGFIEREYCQTGSISEKIDVHDFGMILLELLTGRRPNYAAQETLDNIKEFIAKNELNLVVDSKILEEEGGGGGDIKQERQLRAFAELSLRCLNEKREMRPTMAEVSDELQRLQGLA